ncbi:MAG: hypothetical protein V2A76_17400 [Planctomycetota bacterium]
MKLNKNAKAGLGAFFSAFFLDVRRVAFLYVLVAAISAPFATESDQISH